MGPFLRGILVPLGFFAMVFGIIYLWVTSRNRERMALIERGADPEFLMDKKRHAGGTMKVGMFFLGIGFGVVMGYLFSASGWMEEGAAYPGMIFIFGGGALIVANVWQLRQDKQQALESRNESGKSENQTL